MPNGKLWLWDERWLMTGSIKDWHSILLWGEPSGQSVFHRLEDGCFFRQSAYLSTWSMLLLGGPPKARSLTDKSQAAIYSSSGEYKEKLGDRGFLVLDFNSLGQQLGINAYDDVLEIRKGKYWTTLTLDDARVAFSTLTEEGHCFGALVYGQTFFDGRFVPAIYDGKKIIKLEMPLGYSLGLVSAYKSPDLCAGVIYEEGTSAQFAVAGFKAQGKAVIWQKGKPTLLPEGEGAKRVLRAPVAFLPDNRLIGYYCPIADETSFAAPDSLSDFYLWVTIGEVLSTDINATFGLNEKIVNLSIIGWRDDGGILLKGHEKGKVWQPLVFELTPKRNPDKAPPLSH